MVNGGKVMDTIQEQKDKRTNEIKKLIKENCDEINHLVAGINSPFTYSQIASVQEDLRGILYSCNIKEDI